jgi:DNA-binding CsgD family transcriptional regulator
MSAATKTKRDSAPVAEAGLVVTDLFLKPLAIDDGAQTILSDLNTKGAPEPFRCIPEKIAEALKGWTFTGPSGLRVQLQGLTYSYHCRAYLIGPQNSFLVEPMIALHLQRGPSPDGAIKQIATAYNLTEREVDVLKGISVGLTSKEVAAQKKISPNTVKCYTRAIMLKMNVNTRSGIVGKLLEFMAKDDA